MKCVKKLLNKHALSNCSVGWIGAGRMGYTDVALGIRLIDWCSLFWW